MKKILCGIFAIILIFSIFVACDETENPTNSTTTTTQSGTTATTIEKANVTVDLNEYVGWWFVSQEDMTFDDTNPTRYSNIQMVFISEAIDNKYVTLTSHLFRHENHLDEEPIPWAFQSRVPVGLVGENKFSVEKSGDLSTEKNKMYTFELKDGKVIVDDGKIVLGYKADDSTVFDAAIGREWLVFNNRYEGNWYMYNTNTSDNSLQVNELVVKEFTGDIVKVDYTIGKYKGTDEVIKYERGDQWYSFGAFYLEGGVVATLHFKYMGGDGYVIDLYIGSEVYARGLDNAEYIGRFSDKSDTPYREHQNYYPFNDYRGYWYTEDVEEDWSNAPGVGYNELYIKEIKGNKVTLGYQFAGLTADIVTVEVNNNIAVFDTVYMGETGGKGIIRFDSDKIYLEVRAPEHNSTGLHGCFEYRRTYSLKMSGWQF